MIKKIKEKIKKVRATRIIKPHTNKSREVSLKNFLKKDYKKIEKYAFDMHMLAYNAEKEGLFGNVYAVSHAEVIKKPLAFFIFNTYNPKIAQDFKFFTDKFGPIVINPRIIRHSSIKQPMDEGCLSFPGREMTRVDRYYKITVEFEYLTFNDETNKIKGYATGEAELKGFYSQLFQHEIDHINGINIYKD